MDSDLVMAVSSDGVTFQPWPLAPAKPTRGSVIRRTKGGWDNNQQASPTLLTDPRDPSNATVLMLYVGHCTANCTSTGGASYWFGILGASSQDLVHWKKEAGPVVPWGGSVPDWAAFNGEPGWIYGPDGYFYVFPSGGFNVQPPAENFGACGVDAPLLSGTGNCSSCRVPLGCCAEVWTAPACGWLVGIARSKQPFSGYAPLSPSPIVTPGPPGSVSSQGVFAPSAMLDPRATGGSGQLLARVWYFQSTKCAPNGWCPATINEATAPWPLYQGASTQPAADPVGPTEERERERERLGVETQNSPQFQDVSLGKH
jgi:hypothetical protein